jgi:signal peptidase I
MNGENKKEGFTSNMDPVNSAELETQNNTAELKTQKNASELETQNNTGEYGSMEKTGGRHKSASVLVDLIIYALIIYTCIYLIPTYVIQRTIVDGPSMENTLHNGEHLLVEKISYHLDRLKRFDIVVFYPHGRDSKEYYVKRLIGLPGETVQIKGANIYINGERLNENYGKEPITYAGLAEEPITLGSDEFFVMGDNREVSLDSRYEEVGEVSKENIGGRAIIRIWPLNKFGFMQHD